MDPAEAAEKVLPDYPYVDAAYLFGSTVRGEAGPMSDLDIALLVDENEAPEGAELLRAEMLVSHEFQKLLEVREVDISTFNNLPLYVQHTVLKEGKLIYERSRDARINFEARTIQRYLDFEPTLHLIERYQTEGRKMRCRSS